jgi:hypothetical protein
MENVIIKAMKYDNYVKININDNDILKEKESLIIVIDNNKIYNKLGEICIIIPRYIEYMSEKVDYDDIYLITSYPRVVSKIIDKKTLYCNFKNIKKNENINLVDDEMRIKEISEIINSTIVILEKQKKINIIMLTSIKHDTTLVNNLLNVIKDDRIDLTYINFKLNTLMKYDKYNYIIELKDKLLMDVLISHDNNKLEINIDNGDIFSLDKKLEIIRTNQYILINDYDLDKDINMEIVDVATKEKKNYKIEIEKLEYEDNNLYNYVTFFIQEIINKQYLDYDNSILIKCVDEIYKLKKDIYEKAIITYDNEMIQKLSWINYSMKQITENLVKKIKMNNVKDDLSIIMNKLLIKLDERIEGSKLRDKFNNRILKNYKEYDTQSIINMKEITEFIEEHDEMEDNNEFNMSCEIFNSIITLSSWYDEIKENSILGLLIKLETNNDVKIGILNAKPIIEEITTNYIPIKDYFNTIITHFDKEETNNINGKDIIYGDGIGLANAFIPIYIHKVHWAIAKQYIPYVFGMILTHNPLGYTENHLNFMFYILIDMTKRIYNSNNMISTRWIKSYISILRTCSQITYERKYNIKKLINSYLLNQNKRNEPRLFGNDIILGQILSSSCIIGKNITNDKILKLCEYIYEENIALETYNSYILYTDMKDVTESNIIINEINNRTKEMLETTISFYKMYLLLQSHITNIGGYKKFLDMIDINYGNYPDMKCEEIKKEIIKNKINMNYEDFYQYIPEKKDIAKMTIFRIILENIVYDEDKDVNQMYLDKIRMIKYDQNEEKIMEEFMKIKN